MTRALSAILIFGLGLILSYSGVKAFQLNQTISRVPVTLEEVERSWSSSNSHIFEKHWIIAFSEDGSRAQVPLKTGNANFEYDMRALILTSSKQEVHLVDKLKIKTTVPISDHFAARYGPARINATCQDVGKVIPQKLIGEEILLARRTFRYSRSEIMKDGDSITFTNWLAPDVNCYPLKRTVELRQNNGVTLYSEKLVEVVTLGEPDQALFAIPTDYRELLPSVAAQEVIGATSSKPMPPNVAETYKRMDDNYRKKREIESQ